MVTSAVILFNMYGKKIVGVVPPYFWINCGLYFLIGSWLLTGHSFVDSQR